MALNNVDAAVECFKKALELELGCSSMEASTGIIWATSRAIWLWKAKNWWKQSAGASGLADLLKLENILEASSSSMITMGLSH